MISWIRLSSFCDTIHIAVARTDFFHIIRISLLDVGIILFVICFDIRNHRLKLKQKNIFNFAFYQNFIEFLKFRRFPILGPFIHSTFCPFLCAFWILKMLLTLIDPSALGRLDYATMSQQALMETAVSQADDPKIEAFCDKKGNFLDVQDWRGVTCDSEGNVVGISWNSRIAVCLSWLPATVQTVFMNSGSLFGVHRIVLQFGALPRDLHIIDLRHVRVSNEVSFDTLPQEIEEIIMIATDAKGEIKLESIPETLRRIQIRSHELSLIDLKCSAKGLTDIEVSSGTLHGSLNFRESPPSLIYLNLESNELEGTLSFEGAAQSLKRISLHRNTFQGTLRLQFLPRALIEINIAQSSFTEVLLESALPQSLEILLVQPSYDVHTEKPGAFDFVHIGASMKHVSISRSKLQGTVRLHHLTSLEKLYASDNLLEGTLHSREFSSYLQFMNLARNKLEGSLDLTVLPKRMVLLDLSGNMFSGTINLNQLPQSLRSLHLSDNQLSGAFTIDSVHWPLAEIGLSNNRFEMEALVISIKCAKLPMIYMEGNSVEKVVNASGEELVLEEVIL